MPKYVFECQDCEEIAEVKRTVSDRETPPKVEEASQDCDHNWVKLMTSPLIKRTIAFGSKGRM